MLDFRLKSLVAVKSKYFKAFMYKEQPKKALKSLTNLVDRRSAQQERAKHKATCKIDPAKYQLSTV